jgi:hypothetical protein
MTEDTPEALLRDVLAIMKELRIAHMVVGSFASTLHGEPRTTRDLDLVIDPTSEQLDALLARLDPDSYYVDGDVARDALRRRSMFNVIDMASGWKLDLIVRKARPFSIEELARRRRVAILGVEIDAATAEDTIIAKLEWAREGGSERQLEDVAGILRVSARTLDLAYVDRWVTELGLEEAWRRARVLAEP